MDVCEALRAWGVCSLLVCILRQVKCRAWNRLQHALATVSDLLFARWRFVWHPELAVITDALSVNPSKALTDEQLFPCWPCRHIMLIPLGSSLPFPYSASDLIYTFEFLHSPSPISLWWFMNELMTRSTTLHVAIHTMTWILGCCQRELPLCLWNDQLHQKDGPLVGVRPNS